MTQFILLILPFKRFLNSLNLFGKTSTFFFLKSLNKIKSFLRSFKYRLCTLFASRLADASHKIHDSDSYLKDLILNFLTTSSNLIVSPHK